MLRPISSCVRGVSVVADVLSRVCKAQLVSMSSAKGYLPSAEHIDTSCVLSIDRRNLHRSTESLRYGTLASHAMLLPGWASSYRVRAALIKAP